MNLFPEINPKESLVPMTHYQRPGLRLLVQAPNSELGRGIFRASNGVGYCCVGSTVYKIDGNFQLKPLGAVTAGIGTPVSMQDNGVSLCIVDGSPNGWVVDLANDSFQLINDSTGTFRGARRVDYLDTFLVFGPSPIGSNQFISTTSNQVQFNSLYVGGKTAYPDNLETLIVNRREIILVGSLKSEIWYDAGNAQLPFAELPGAFIEHGIVAPYSVVSTDINVFWLGQDLQGQGIVFRQRGYETTRISNHALEYQIRQMIKSAGSVADAVGYTYQQDGHYFYVLNFPSGDQTWVFDDSIGDPMMAWHQRGWTDINGALHRERPMGAALINGLNVALDWENGAIYAIDPEYYVDDVGGVQSPISYARSFPHIGLGIQGGQLVQSDGQLIQFESFIADIETGTIQSDPQVGPAKLTLKYSDDRGRTFTGVIQQSLGEVGEYRAWPTWRVLGQARDRIFDLSWTGNGPVALNGAWAVGTVRHV